MDIAKYTTNIFKIKTDAEFERLALQAFAHQKKNCPVYKEYLQLIGKENLRPKHASEIPFLPIKLFKSRQIICKEPASSVAGKNLPDGRFHTAGNSPLHNCLHTTDNTVIFTSSATTGMISSKHYITDIKLYEKDFIKSFEYFYGNIKNYNLLALLPSYLERKGSSLVYMADSMIKRIKAAGGEGGFYLYNHEKLLKDLTRLCRLKCAGSAGKHKPGNRITILLGVSFALLDFVKFLKTKRLDSSAALQKSPKEKCYQHFDKYLFENLIVMETGGMKGRGKELKRNELHAALSKGFGFSSKDCGASLIHSEYGMAELLSQAYSTGNGVFQTPPWMKIFTRDLMDPFKITGATGGINIIDLANINSCCFIETEDRGTLITDNTHSIPHRASTHGAKTGCTFTIDGRIKNSELRGCNMLITK
ncbi:MAG: acyltransferase [Bacteroidales bacterium]